MAAPTAQEQLSLELINRSRMDPGGEFARQILDADTQTGYQGNITGALRFFDVDMGALQNQFSSMVAAPPVAWSSVLNDVATDHSQAMLDNDQQGHTINGVSFGQRMQNSGLDYRGASENVFAYTQDMVHGHAGFMVDWGNGSLDRDGDGIQDGAGHRVNIMNASWNVVGIGVIEDPDTTNEVGRPFLQTQNFAQLRNYSAQLMGVVTDDTDGDFFYDIGEGLGGVTITAQGTAGTFTTTSWGSGGYQMVVPPGEYTVTFEGGMLTGRVVQTVTMTGNNTKLDARQQDAARAELGTGTSDVLTADPTGSTLRGLAGNDTLNGLDGDDVLDGGTGADALNGGGGQDLATYVNAGAGVRGGRRRQHDLDRLPVVANWVGQWR